MVRQKKEMMGPEEMGNERKKKVEGGWGTEGGCGVKGGGWRMEVFEALTIKRETFTKERENPHKPSLRW